AKGEIEASIPADEAKTAVFLPTTPHPTSGFLLFLPKSDVIELNMSVEDAAKLVISAGLVYPDGAKALPTPIGEVRQPTAKASSA
ncbi:MAG: hypothetical protein HKP29_13315, partial [Silicimonas sp.]|nr:hypothetical protein [Silicimonas sp.]